jgi:hypothetical protein
MTVQTSSVPQKEPSKIRKWLQFGAFLLTLPFLCVMIYNQIRGYLEMKKAEKELSGLAVFHQAKVADVAAAREEEDKAVQAWAAAQETYVTYVTEDKDAKESALAMAAATREMIKRREERQRKERVVRAVEKDLDAYQRIARQGKPWRVVDDVLGK